MPPLPPLRVSADRRRLETADGAPFFWLGDTAWELFHRGTREQILHYLRNRAAKGFNLIQVVALAEIDGLDQPNAEGHLCLLEGDPARPNPAYFELVDWALDQAATLGLRVALLPTWASHVGDPTWPRDRIVFDPAKARAYGLFLGRRYAGHPHLVWVLGGDRPCLQPATLAVWRALAEALREAGAGQLRTWHPPGGRSSSDYLADEPWLDFHLLQSSHFRKHCENWRMIRRDWERSPVKPVLDAEPCYEEMPVGFKPAHGLYFDAYDVRQAAYWSVFAGGCGVTYGCQAVWQMWEPGRAPRCGRVLRDWRESLDLPGAFQMRHLLDLMASRPGATRRPAQELVIEEWPCSLGSSNHLAVTRDDPPGGSTWLMAYSPLLPLHLQIDTRVFPPEPLRLWAYDPRQGVAHDHGQHPNVGRLTLPSPQAGVDWVFVLDRASAGYGPPGRSR